MVHIPPPAYIPENVCADQCNVCGERWFENTITMVKCQCEQLRICPNCALKLSVPQEMEHNLVNCNFIEEDN